MRRRFTSAGCRMLMVLLILSGCANQSIIDDPGKVKQLAPAKEKELVIWHTYSDEETRLFENILVPLFEKQHPDIHIRSVRQSHNNELKAALISRASSRKTPDLVRMDIAWVPEFAQLGLLYPVSRFTDFAQIAKGLHEEALETSAYEDQYYGLPLNMNTKAAIYNRELLGKAGYATPPETMEELIAIAEKYHYVIGMSGTSPWGSLPYFLGLGGKLTNEHYTKASGYLNSKESITALTKLVELYRKQILNPDLFTGQGDTWNGVIQGKMLMMDEGPWFYSVLLNSKETEEDVMNATVQSPFPYNHGNTSILGGENLVMLKGTRYKEEAWTFMKWMTAQETQVLMYKTGLIPTNKAAISAYGVDNTFIKAYVDGLEHAYIRPPIRSWEKIDKLYTSYMTAAFSGEMQVKEALDEAAVEIDKLLVLH